MLKYLALALTSIVTLVQSTDAQWTYITPYYYSKTSALVRSTGGTLYSTGTGYAYRSTNNGVQWERVSKIFSKFIAGSNDTVYGLYNQILYYSTDRGSSWSEIDTVKTTTIWRHSSGVFFRGHNVLERSRDNCKTWEEIKPDYQGLSGIDAFDIASNGELLAIKRTSFYTSSDLGDTWTRSRPPLSSKNEVKRLIESSDGRFIVVSADSFAVSTDRGLTWTEKSSLFPFAPGELTSIAADSSGNILATRKNLLYSYKEGVVTMIDSAINVMTTSDKRIWVRKTMGRLGYYQKGLGDFQERTTGFIGHTINEMQRLPNGEYYVNAELDTRLFSKDLVSWQIQKHPDSLLGTGYLQTSPDGSFYIRSHDNLTGSKLYRSTDNARTWSVAAQKSYSNLYGVDSSGAVYFGFFRSTDQGDSWQPFPLPNNGGIISFGPSGMIVADLVDRLSLTTDDGQEWDTVRNYGRIGFVQTLLVLNDRTIVIRDADSVWSSTDRGKTWNSSRPPGKAYSFIMTLDEKQRVFIAKNDTSIFLYDPYTASYRHIIDKPANAGWMLVHNGRLLIHTDNGFYTTTLAEFATVPEQKQSDNSAYYADGVLKLSSPVLGNLDVLDITGRSVKTIVMTDPVRSIFIGDLPTGIYFARCATAVAKFVVTE